MIKDLIQTVVLVYLTRFTICTVLEIFKKTNKNPFFIDWSFSEPFPLDPKCENISCKSTNQKILALLEPVIYEEHLKNVWQTGTHNQDPSFSSIKRRKRRLIGLHFDSILV